MCAHVTHTHACFVHGNAQRVSDWGNVYTDECVHFATVCILGKTKHGFIWACDSLNRIILDLNFTWVMSGRWRKYNKNVIIPYLLK